MVIKPILCTIAVLIVGTSHAQTDKAEALVASKQKADMSYRQLMEILGQASSMIHDGIIRENKQMVKEGANIILHHPAPRYKPWSIMPAADQVGFKQSLLAFDKILDTYAGQATEEADKGNWIEAGTALHDLNTSCVSCHAMWKNKVRQ